MKTKFNVLVLATAVALTACSGEKTEQTESSVPANEVPAMLSESKPQFEVDANFQGQLAGVFNAYVSLKEAFVASDAAKVSAEATLAVQKLGEVNATLPEGAAKNDWEGYGASMGTSLAEMITSTDIEGQRAAFSRLSDTLYKSVKAYGLGGTTAYYQFCPMAFNNEGGYWLTNEEKVLNPYFGDKMLHCGVVKEKLN